MKKRMCSIVLLLAFCMGCLPAARAEGSTRKGNGDGTDSCSITVVNPLYEHVLEEGDLAQAETADANAEEGASSFSQKNSKQAAGTKQYTELDSAAAFVRSQMANRKTVVAFTYRNVSSEDQKVSIVKQIVQEALAENDHLNQGDYLRWQYGGYSCDIQEYWIANGDGTFTYHYKFVYTFTYYTTAEQERELNTRLEQVLESLKLDQATEYQQIKRIYSYICQNVEYDYDTLNDSSTGKYTAYNAMMKETAVCQGYALLLYRMLREAGFSTRIIAGIATESGENHAWNIVRLGDRYYYLDSTWDASGNGYYDYFMRGKDGFEGHNAWEDYTNDAFQAAYPVADTSYEPSVTDEPDLNAGIAAQGTCGSDVTWSLSDAGVLTLRGSGAMEDYAADGAPWAQQRSKITAVDIGCGITAIGANAFQGCTALAQAVVLPDSVTSVGTGAFRGCTALPSVDVMPNVTAIASDAFADCGSGFTLRGVKASAAAVAAVRAGLSLQVVSDIAEASVSLSQQSYSYTGSVCTPEVTATAADGTAVEAYALSYTDNVNAGTAQAVLTGTGEYGGKTAVSFQIEKAVPDVYVPTELVALRGQKLRDVLLSCRFAWQTPDESVGMQTGQQTFLLDYTPEDTDNYQSLTDIPVKVDVRDTIGLSCEQAASHVGAQVRLIASGLASNGPQDILTWTTSDDAIAAVSSEGVVTAQAPGTAVITATSTNGELAQCTIDIGQLPFDDVPDGSWYFSAVSYGYANAMFAGITDTTFRPGQNMTRAMLVQVLYNQEGKPSVAQKSAFTDVPDGAWYTDAVVWGTRTGVVSGRGNGKFAPNASVTRQEAAQILYNYAGYKEYSTASNVSISRFDDDQNVSNWAIHAMQWAVGYSLMSGVGDNRLAPKGKATRAQLAQIMMQFDYNIVYG